MFSRRRRRCAVIRKLLSEIPQLPAPALSSTPACRMIRCFESLLLRCSTLHFSVAAADRAPIPVISHWHAAFDADTHALCGFRGLRRKQAPEKRHSTSPVVVRAAFL